MLCPYCGFEHTPGADTCEECVQPLTAIEPAAEAPASHNILYNKVEVLHPAVALKVSPDEKVGDAIRTMVAQRIGCVLVGEGEELDGIFSERDVLMKVSTDLPGQLEHPVREFMTADPETVQIDDDVAFALHKMDVGGYRHLPVIAAGRIVGIISIRDVLKLLVEEIATSA